MTRTDQSARPSSMTGIVLAILAAICVWVLFGTDACHHPVEHVAAFMWLTMATPPIAMAWAAGRWPGLLDEAMRLIGA